jgi:hypothetical protein
VLYTKLGARRRAVVAGHQLRVSSLRVSTVAVVPWLLRVVREEFDPGGEERACIELKASSKYA